ncbi:MAG TPA: hypothetical protein VMW35_16680 [Myxococcota bacterium]|jgi:hypothetical protein|nr:hypothetical protein [Myxococcota bacterium]
MEVLGSAGIVLVGLTAATGAFFVLGARLRWDLVLARARESLVRRLARERSAGTASRDASELGLPSRAR